MKTFTLSLLVAVAALAVTSSSQAAPVTKPSGVLVADVTVNGQYIGTFRFATTGQAVLPRLGSGHQVAVQIVNGQVVLARAVNSAGKSLATTGRTEVVAGKPRPIIAILIGL